MSNCATAIAHPNIALIKYWGNRDKQWVIPSNGSISMNLAQLESRTTVTFRSNLIMDSMKLNERQLDGESLSRVSRFISFIRQIAGIKDYAQIISNNSFPTGSGIASSASGFAALTIAAVNAAGLQLSEKELSRLARTGSGSACRSIPGGFVEWLAGTDHQDSYAHSIAPPKHWDLIDHIAVVSEEHKSILSLDGHSIAHTSPLQGSRLADVDARLGLCRQAILNKDFACLADVVELDSNMMHAVMMTSTPRLFYWQPETIAIMQAVHTWRQKGLEVCYTIDAGPNVHVICTQASSQKILDRLKQIDGVMKVISSGVGGPAYIIE